MAGGPLGVAWGEAELGELRAGSLARVRVQLENTGRAPWRSRREGGIFLSYHWLDDRGNALVWDGIRTSFEDAVSPGERLTASLDVRAPVPPGPYRFAIDVVAEGRAWFAELGNEVLERNVEVAPRIARRLAVRGGDAGEQEEPLVAEDAAEAIAYLAAGVEPAPDWSRRILDAHQEGYAIVAGSIEAESRRDRRTLARWAPGPGRVPTFAHPLICPSVVKEIEPRWVADVDGLPALDPPDGLPFRREPWLYDGRITARLRSDRPRG